MDDRGSDLEHVDVEPRVVRRRGDESCGRNSAGASQFIWYSYCVCVEVFAVVRHHLNRRLLGRGGNESQQRWRAMRTRATVQRYKRDCSSISARRSTSRRRRQCNGLSRLLSPLSPSCQPACPSSLKLYLRIFVVLEVLTPYRGAGVLGTGAGRCHHHRGG